ncbi:cytochrome c-type biogenesis protein CcmH [Pelagibacteraceae bacterium]|nr:cytochrome c-type biogenesis protein CcmH [Pelagibacteraceae bacterium]
MKIIKILLAIFIIMSLFDLEAIEKNDELKKKILKNIRCLICQGQSIYDSESDFAASIKLTVEKKIIENSSEKEIYEFLRQKYGDWIIYDPKLNKNTYILWLLPLLLFLLGGAIIYRNIIIKKIK